ncbi:hypothetical protein TNCV_4958781 [Trichonephila clavipes]|uniref:Uncharacterized protein n=1 Tax=Trichonephila clavipes TaxID=2585209 RepID=A0A8X6VME4_TRICX|nr:hypothetical protein TNCV_4958781 [Trichonephila clavipes]
MHSLGHSSLSPTALGRQDDEKATSGCECTKRCDWATKHTSSVRCLETFRSIFALILPLVHSNSWGAQLSVLNDPRYARLEANLGNGQAKEG